MAGCVAEDGRRFRYECEMIDVTSMSRPDPSWQCTDPNGHLHQWFTDGAPATSYNPSKRYTVPTLRTVSDETYVDEWGDECELSHQECVICGAHVTPGITSDTHRHFIQGLKSYYIDDVPVDKATFEAEARKSGLM